MSNRLGMHNLIPGTGLLKTSEPEKWRDTLEILGPAAGLARNVAKGANAILDGYPAGAKEALPKAIKDVAKGVDMAKTGMYRDSRGGKIADTSKADAFFMAIGFMPREVADRQRETRADPREGVPADRGSRR